MASTISTIGFDAAFPVAGQDNDSQGFRTNFNVTKVALEAAASEITTLQSDTAKLNADNAFNGSVISEAEFKANTETVYASGSVTSSQNVSWANGHYQTLQAGGNITLTLADWPESGVMGKMRLQITGDGTERTIVWAAAGGGTFKNDANWPSTFTVTNQTNPVIVDFWTINGGISVFAQYHGSFV
jgi:hypothetical protein